MFITKKSTASNLIAVLLAFAMLQFPFAFALSDVSDHWANNQIARWQELGIIKGYEDGSFMPENQITRAEFSKILNGVFGYKNMSDHAGSDVTPGSWYEDDMKKALMAGYIKGYEDGSTRPDNPITRQEAAVMLSRAFFITGTDDATNFSDNDQIDDWAIQAISGLSQAGALSGFEDDTIRPKNNITRAETVKVFDNLVAEIYTTPDTREDQTIEGNLMICSEDLQGKNLTINGNLYISPAVGESEAAFEDVSVAGSTFILGGGTSTVKFVNSHLNNVFIAKQSPVNVVFDGGTLGMASNHTPDSRMEFNGNIEIGSVTLDAKTRLFLNQGVTIPKIAIADQAEQTTISGNGNISNIVTDTGNINIESGIIAPSIVDSSGNAITPGGTTGGGTTGGGTIGGGGGGGGGGTTTLPAAINLSDSFLQLESGKTATVSFTKSNNTTVALDTTGENYQTIIENCDVQADYVKVVAKSTIDFGDAEYLDTTITLKATRGNRTAAATLTVRVIPTNDAIILTSNSTQVIPLPDILTDIDTAKEQDGEGNDQYYVEGNQIELLRSLGAATISYTLDESITELTHENTRINVSLAPEGSKDTSYLLAYNGTNTFETIRTGFIGLATGQPISDFFTVSTLTFFATEAGVYTLTLELVDASNQEVLATGSLSISVINPPAPTASIDEISGNLTALTAGSVTFVLTTEGMEAGTEFVINDLPEGVEADVNVTTGDQTTVTLSATETLQYSEAVQITVTIEDFTTNAITLTIDKKQAEAFTINTPEGEFDSIDVTTEDLGTLSVESFQITFDEQPVTVQSVDEYSEGKYVVNFDSLTGDGEKVLSVTMTGELVNYLPHASAVTVVPTALVVGSVVLDPQSEGTAGDGKITELQSGSLYKVIVDTETKYVQADGTLAEGLQNLAPLTGTEIKQLENGETYNVVKAIAIDNVVALPHLLPDNMPPTEIPPTTQPEDGTLALEVPSGENSQWGVLLDMGELHVVSYARTAGATGAEDAVMGAIVYPESYEPAQWLNYADQQPLTTPTPSLYHFIETAGEQTPVPAYLLDSYLMYVNSIAHISYRFFEMSDGSLKFLKISVYSTE